MRIRWTEADARRFLQKPTRSSRPAVAVQGAPCVTPVHLVLPYPVLNNRYYRHFQGRTVLSAEGRMYRKVVEQVVRTQWPVGVKRPFNNLLFLTIHLHVPSRRYRPDADAPLKAPFDAMTYAGVYVDDKLVRDFNFRQKEPRPPEGCIEIWLEPWREEP